MCETVATLLNVTCFCDPVNPSLDLAVTDEPLALSDAVKINNKKGTVNFKLEGLKQNNK